MGQVQILVAGISATGKSTFGQWLAETKGFIHVDMELPDSKEYSWRWNGLRKAWDAFYDGSDRDILIRELKGVTAPVVLNWGFPPRELPVIRALKASGVSLWWFRGDRNVARKAFEGRTRQQLAQQLANSPIQQAFDLQLQMRSFDIQYEGLSTSQAEIEPLFRGHVITTLQPNGTLMENEEIFSIMGL